MFPSILSLQQASSPDLRGSDDTRVVLPSLLFSGLGYNRIKGSTIPRKKFPFVETSRNSPVASSKAEPPADEELLSPVLLSPFGINLYDLLRVTSSISGESFAEIPYAHQEEHLREHEEEAEPGYFRDVGKYVHRTASYFLTLFP